MIPFVGVIVGDGINCDRELEHALRRAGAEVERMHLSDLLMHPEWMEVYDIIGLPGGFAHGDDTFAGNIFTQKIRHSRLKEKFARHIDKGGLIFGVCNGNQIGTMMNLIPVFGEVLGEPEVAYTYNDSARYEDRGNVNIKVMSQKSHWLKGITQLNNIPVGHGEGKFYTKPETLRELYRKDLVALKYCYADGRPAEGRYPVNPNGSTGDIAGLATEQVLLMMPHPERAIMPYNQDGWTRRKSSSKREGKQLPEEGDGMRIFRNGVDYSRRKI